MDEGRYAQDQELSHFQPFTAYLTEQGHRLEKNINIMTAWQDRFGSMVDNFQQSLLAINRQQVNMTERIDNTEGQIGGLLARVEGAEQTLQDVRSEDSVARIAVLEEMVTVLQDDLREAKENMAMDRLGAQVTNMEVRVDTLMDNVRDESERTRQAMAGIEAGEARLQGLIAQFESVRRDVARHNDTEAEKLLDKVHQSVELVQKAERDAQRRRKARAIMDSAHEGATPILWSTSERGSVGDQSDFTSEALSTPAGGSTPSIRCFSLEIDEDEMASMAAEEREPDAATSPIAVEDAEMPPASP